MEGDFEGEDIYGTYGEAELGGDEVDVGDVSDVEAREEEVFGEDVEEKAIAMEEAEFSPSFEQLQNLRYRETTGEIVEGISKGMQRSMRTPEENAKEQMQIFLTDSRFNNLQESRKEAIIHMAEKFINLPLLSTEILTFACLWKIEKHELSKKEIQNFGAKYKIPIDNHIDLVRYLRMF